MATSHQRRVLLERARYSWCYLSVQLDRILLEVWCNLLSFPEGQWGGWGESEIQCLHKGWGWRSVSEPVTWWHWKEPESGRYESLMSNSALCILTHRKNLFPSSKWQIPLWWHTRRHWVPFTLQGVGVGVGGSLISHGGFRTATDSIGFSLV